MKKLLLSLLAGALVIPLAAQKWQKNFDFVDECICSVSKVRKDGKIGYVDINGKVIIPLEYDEGLTFNEGYAAVRKGAQWAYMDSTGHLITEFIFADAMGFGEGLAPAKKNAGWGFINTKGEEVVPYIYSNARKFSQGLAAVSNKPKEFWGYINKKGEEIIPFNLDFADSFTEEGEARVIKRGKVMWINRSNEKVRE